MNLTKPNMIKTEVGVEVTIRRKKRGKGAVLSFDKQVLHLELSPYEAHFIAYHLEPKEKVKP